MKFVSTTAILLAFGAYDASGEVDLSPMLKEVLEEEGLVGVTAFTASTSGVCAVGSAGSLAVSKPESPVSLWNSPWHSGSLTKSMIASLAALLVKDDNVQLDYDTTLREIFPLDALDTPYSNVTLEHLLGHRGGFHRDFVESLEQIPQIFSVADQMPLMEQRQKLVQYGLTTPPAKTPIDEYLYSNMGYTVAAIMMETVTGIAWEDMLISRIFSPLGMKSAHFGCPDTPESPLGHFWDIILNTLVPVAPASFCDCIATKVFGCDCISADNTLLPLTPFDYAQAGPAGTVYMQLSDYIRYYQWHLAGELGKDTSGLLTQEEFHRIHTKIGEVIGDDGAGYGHGWFVGDEFPPENPYGLHGPFLNHDGSNLLWYAMVWMFPEMDRVYFTAMNSHNTKKGAEVEGKAVIGKLFALDDFDEDLEGSQRCPPIDDLDRNRDPGSHATCPALVYGYDYVEESENGTESGGHDNHRTQGWALVVTTASAVLSFLW